jgi:hypothetical protein
VLAAGGCDLFDGTPKSPPPPCTGDEQCGDGQVCFADGCGDPGEGIVVEVIPGTATGQLARDFPIDSLEAVEDLPAFEPAVILGAIQQESPLNAEAVPYTGDVIVRAHGESVLIPGRKRFVQYTVTPDQGAYEVAIPAGSFTVTYTPVDPRLPPLRRAEQLVQPGQALNLNLLLPNHSSVVPLTGRLLKKAATSTLDPDTFIPEPMQVQAFEPGTCQHPATNGCIGEVYSQRAPVDLDTGAFTLFIQPRLDMERMIIRATPRDPTALVPSKDFDVPFTTPLPSPLELGNYDGLRDDDDGDGGDDRADGGYRDDDGDGGDDRADGGYGGDDDDNGPIDIAGRLVDGAGNPVERAAVLVEGTARGGGTFKTQAVKTDLQGRFTLQTLEPGFGTQLTLWAFPEPTSTAGIVRVQISRVQISSTGDVGEIRAPDKVEVTGLILRPGDGGPAAGVIVEAEPLAAIADPVRAGEFLPLPRDITRGVSDAKGRYTLRLDPASYRLDFVPTDLLPRVSRFTTVQAPGSTGQLEPLALPDFKLSQGRRVTGTVRSIPRRFSTGGPVPAPFASVKFFRVVNDKDGKPSSSIPLAETLADANGQYSIVFPTAPRSAP